LITNATSRRPGELLAIKSIDTAIVSTKDEEAFVYTSIVKGEDLDENIYSSPFFLQQALTPKLDVRLTIIGSELLAIYIKGKGGISGDWRKFDGDLQYEVFNLPADVKSKCLKFVEKLNLNYAAIDMVVYNSEYYFIEVNPTGEWAWLQKSTGIDIGLSIATFLCHEDMDQ
jgi:hypothetical protein